jgi:hypothetical protein
MDDMKSLSSTDELSQKQIDELKLDCIHWVDTFEVKEGARCIHPWIMAKGTEDFKKVCHWFIGEFFMGGVGLSDKELRDANQSIKCKFYFFLFSSRAALSKMKLSIFPPPRYNKTWHSMRISSS